MAQLGGMQEVKGESLLIPGCSGCLQGSRGGMYLQTATDSEKQALRLRAEPGSTRTVGNLDDRF